MNDEHAMRNVLIPEGQDDFIKEVEEYKHRYFLETHKRLSDAALANLVGIRKSRLSELLNNKRPLSVYFLTPFLEKGVCDVRKIQINDGESKQKDRFKRMSLLLRDIELLRERNYPIESHIKELVDFTNPNKKPTSTE